MAKKPVAKAKVAQAEEKKEGWFRRNIINPIVRHKKEIAAFGTGAAVGVGGTIGYAVYKNRRDKKARNAYIAAPQPMEQPEVNSLDPNL